MIITCNKGKKKDAPPSSLKRQKTSEDLAAVSSVPAAAAAVEPASENVKIVENEQQESDTSPVSFEDLTTTVVKPMFSIDTIASNILKNLMLFGS